MKICFPHKAPKIGGPGSFQKRLESQLKRDGHTIIYSNDKNRPDLIIVIGGTRKLLWLLKNKIIGVPIILRLGGLNWLHRHINYGLKYFIKAELSNYLARSIKFLSDYIVYQSYYVKDIWEKGSKKTNLKSTVIYNAVDIGNFKVDSEFNTKTKSIIFLEGNIDYSPFAVDVINHIASNFGDLYKIKVYGSFENENNISRILPVVKYFGTVKHEDIDMIFKNCVYVPLDIKPACPNTVIEALASGVPVAGFNTGAMGELVPNNCGRLVDVNNNIVISSHELSELTKNINDIMKEWNNFSDQSRLFASEKFDIKEMYQKYINVVNQLIEQG